MAKHRHFSDQFEANVTLEVLRGDKTVQEPGAKHQLHPNHLSTWRRQVIDRMADVFSAGKKGYADITLAPVRNGCLRLVANVGRA